MGAARERRVGCVNRSEGSARRPPAPGYRRGVPLKIEDYALVGDLETGALVGRDGSVDWLCLPRFDAAACFAALLGDEEHGRWQIAPTASWTSERRYREGSLVLETDFTTDGGVVRLVDCMPQGDGRHDLVRVVQGLSGEVEVRLEYRVRLGYGRDVPWVRRMTDTDGDPAVVAVAGPDGLALRGEVELEARGGHHEAVFTVREGETLRFALTWFPSHEPVPACYDVDDAVAGVDAFWQEWSGACSYEGLYRDAVVRSLVTLKALTYLPTGGIVAAPTTSLPETFGGSRNWDYRYCWLRDATLTLWALLDSGYTDTAREWRDWLLRAVAGDPEDLQIMYGLGGERRLAEYELPHLPGYEGSAPVRVGNAASEQFQLDVYGEVINALSQARDAGVPSDSFAWSVQRTVLAFLADNWQREDASLWEVRGVSRRFTHSALLCWVAFDRAVRAVEEDGLDDGGCLEEWRRLRDEVREEVLTRGWSEEAAGLHAVLRRDRPGRLRPHDAAVRVPAGGRRADARDGAGGGGRPAARPARRAVPDQRRGARGGRAGGARGLLPRLLLLARGEPGAGPGPLRGGRGAVRGAAGAAQRRRAAGRGVRPRGRQAGRQLPAGLQPRRARGGRDGAGRARAPARAAAATRPGPRRAGHVRAAR